MKNDDASKAAGVIVVLCLIGFGIWWMLGPASISSVPPGIVEPARPEYLTAGITTRAGWVQIRNEDDFDWRGAKASINEGVLSGGFFCEIGELKAGEKAERSLRDFANAAGLRFDERTHKINQIGVKAETTHGALLVYMTK